MDYENFANKLKKSFFNVKEEIEVIKDVQDKQNAYIAENLQHIESLKVKNVSIEKFEYLKKQISELNENAKKIWEIEEEIKSVDERTVSKTFFNQQHEQLTDEFDDVKNGLSLLNKETISKYQMNELIADLNDEFSKVKTTIEEIRNIKDSITHKELEKKTNTLNHKIDDSNKHVKILEDLEFYDI